MRTWSHGRIAVLASGLGLGVGVASGLGFGLTLLGWEALARRREADLRGRVALVTGGSRGLGLLLARELAREGCRLAICARGDEELQESRRALEAEGAAVLAVRCDVSDRAQAEHFVNETAQRFGQIDICVNNAGIIQVGPVETMTAEDFQQAMAVMFWGTVYPTLAVLPEMLKRRAGHIVNITSIGGKVSVPHLLPYNCAKFAAVAFSEGLHAELASRRIRVLTVVPGLMRTGSHINAWFKGRREAEYAWFSLGASLPGLSMDAERAARQIVRAIKRNAAQATLGLPAQVLERVHGLFPGATVALLGLANAVLLPRANGGGAPAARGRDLEDRMDSRWLNAATVLGRSAARRFQHASRVHGSIPARSARDGG
jgi:NAD(P)-dependent dehydrogenase (short-subunit alcohol dehydrogenase family)